MPTNWVIENFCIVQEDGANILMENNEIVALQEFDSTTWTEQTTTGSG